MPPSSTIWRVSSASPMKTGGTLTSQSIQIRNAGAGTLRLDPTRSTADGGNWLSASISSGAAPSTISIGITKTALPGGGATAGTFVGQLLFQTSGDSVHTRGRDRRLAVITR